MSIPTPPTRALVLGGTGQTGRHLLQSLLASPQYTRVGEYGRKVTDAAGLPAGKDKLEQKVIDFEKLDDAGLKDGKWDVVYIALGTTRAAAGSAAAFEKIDREYVVNAARAARSADPTHHQRVVYISSTGASSSSRFLYTRSKGLTEEGLAGLGYSDTIVFRPAMLMTSSRAERSFAEGVASCIFGTAAYFTPRAAISVETLGQSAALAGSLGSAALPAAANAYKAGKPGEQYTVISNAGALALAKTTS